MLYNNDATYYIHVGSDDCVPEAKIDVLVITIQVAILSAALFVITYTQDVLHSTHEPASACIGLWG